MKRLWPILFIAAIAAATPFVFGLYIQSTLDESVAAHALRMKKQGTPLNLRLRDYQRGWLGSSAELEVSQSGAEGSIRIPLTIQHGPLISRVSHDTRGWVGAMAAIDGSMGVHEILPVTNPELDPDERERLSSDLALWPPITVNAITQFTGNTVVRLGMEPGEHTEPGGARISVKGGSGTLWINADRSSRGEVTFQGFNAHIDAQSRLELGRVSVQFEQADIDDILSAQSFEGRVEDVFARPGGPADSFIRMEGLRMASHLNSESRGLHARVLMAAERIQVSGVAPEKDGDIRFHLALGLGGLSRAAAEDLMALQWKLRFEKDKDAIAGILTQTLTKVLRGSGDQGPFFEVTRLSASRDGAPLMDGKLHLQLNDAGDIDQTAFAKPLVLLSKLSGDVALKMNLDFVRTSMARRNLPEVRSFFEDQGREVGEEQIQATAERMADMALNLSTGQGFLVVEDGMVGTSARLETGLELTLNGKAMPIKQLLSGALK